MYRSELICFKIILLTKPNHSLVYHVQMPLNRATLQHTKVFQQAPTTKRHHRLASQDKNKASEIATVTKSVVIRTRAQ